MKKLFLTSAIIFSCAANANAVDPNDSKWPYWYVGLNAGAVVSSDSDYKTGATKGSFDPDSGFAYTATLGYAPSNLRVEAEFGASNQNISDAASDGDVRTYRVMANAIYDFGTSLFNPYIGGGLGVLKADISPTNVPGINGSDQTFAYQALAGFNLGEVAPNVNLNIGYRYIGTFSDLKVANTKFDYSAHQVEAGARFRF